MIFSLRLQRLAVPLLAMLLSVLLAACSSNPYAVEPNPVPSVEKALKVHKLWRHDTGAGLNDEPGARLRPAVTLQQAFAADVDGRVSAFTREKGKRQWQVKTGYRISGGLYAGYDKVLFGTRDGQAVALSATDGSVLWHTQLSSEILSVPASDGTRAVFQTQDGQITALDMSTGKPVWNYTVTVPNLMLRGAATPLIDGGIVYVGLASGKVIALGMSDGAPMWEEQVAIPTGTSELDRLVDIDNNLIVDQGGLFASSYQGKVAVMDAQHGQLFWGRDISTYTPMSSRANTLFIAGADGDVSAVNERDGAFTWQQKALHGRHLIGTVIQDGYVVTGDFEGWLYWLDPADGKLLARKHVAGAFAGAPVVYDDVIYVLADNGKLSAYTIEAKK